MEDKKITPETEAQEQHVLKCEYCGKINDVSLPKKLHPEFCMHCGKRIKY